MAIWFVGFLADWLVVLNLLYLLIVMDKRRTEQNMYALILQVATANQRIRAVILNGSRANPNNLADAWSDYDIVYMVEDICSFLSNHAWVDVFGKRIIMQMPDAMTIEGSIKDKRIFAYLMLFEDGNRVDLTLFPAEKLATDFKIDSLSAILLDKDNIFGNVPLPSDADYLIKPPSEKEFTDCCNEFWWVSAYVAKGLCRGQLTYAKAMMEQPVRAMFMKAIEWYIGADTNFTVPFGIGGKHMKQYLMPDLYKKILLTYPDADGERIWEALLLMATIFSGLMKDIANRLNFIYNIEEEENAHRYLDDLYSSTKLQ